MREKFADFAIMITTWDWPIHGPLWVEVEKASYNRLLAKYKKKGFKEPESEVDNKITESYGSSGTGGWKKVPDRFKIGSWAFNAYEVKSPKKVLNLLNEKYLPSCSVPSQDSPNGWKYLNGMDLLEWQNKWIQSILRNHPEFPLKDRLKLTLAINYQFLNEVTNAVKILDELSCDSNISAWVNEFRRLQREQRAKQGQLP